jgi:hypothetical protein
VGTTPYSSIADTVRAGFTCGRLCAQSIVGIAIKNNIGNLDIPFLPYGNVRKKLPT